MRVLPIDLTFEHEYRVTPVGSLPENDQILRLYFPEAAEVSGERNVAIRVDPHDSRPWFGMFAGDFGDEEAASVVACCPNPRQICVVAGGDGYLVDTSQPTRWSKVEAFPIRDLIPIRERELLLFADETEVVAYGVTGLVWRTPRLVSDDIKITAVTARSIIGSGWDASQGHEVEFEIDIKTGDALGGIQYLPKKDQ